MILIVMRTFLKEMFSAVIVVVSCIAAYFCTFWLNGNESDASDVSPHSKDVLYWPIVVNEMLLDLAIGFYPNRPRFNHKGFFTKVSCTV